MRSPINSNRIHHHQSRIIQIHLPPFLHRHEYRISILAVQQVPMPEIRRVIRALDPVPRERGEQRARTFDQVAGGFIQVVHGGEGVVAGADAGEAFGGVGAGGDVCAGEAADEGGEVLGCHGVCLV